MAAGILFRDDRGRVLLVEPSYKPNWEIPGGVVEADESPWAGVLQDRDLRGLVFPDAEIVSAEFVTLAEARTKVKPTLADRLAAAVEAAELGVTALCEQGRRVS
jgi:hypothetical protein